MRGRTTRGGVWPRWVVVLVVAVGVTVLSLLRGVGSYTHRHVATRDQFLAILEEVELRHSRSVRGDQALWTDVAFRRRRALAENETTAAVATTANATPNATPNATDSVTTEAVVLSSQTGDTTAAESAFLTTIIPGENTSGMSTLLPGNVTISSSGSSSFSTALSGQPSASVSALSTVGPTTTGVPVSQLLPSLSPGVTWAPTRQLLSTGLANATLDGEFITQNVTTMDSLGERFATTPEVAVTPSDDADDLVDFQYLLTESDGQTSIVLFSMTVLGSVVVFFLLFFYAGWPVAVLFNGVVRFFVPDYMAVSAHRITFAFMGGKVFFSDLRIGTPHGAILIKSAVAHVQWWNKKFIDARARTQPQSTRHRIPFRITIKCQMVEVVLIGGTTGTSPNSATNGNSQQGSSVPGSGTPSSNATTTGTADIGSSTSTTQPSSPLSTAGKSVLGTARFWIFKWLPSISYEINTGCIYIAPPHLSLMWAARFEKAEGILLDLHHPSAVSAAFALNAAPSIIYRVVNKMILFKIGVYLMPTHSFDTTFRRRPRKKRTQSSGARGPPGRKRGLQPLRPSEGSTRARPQKPSGGSRAVTVAEALRTLYRSTIASLLGGKVTGSALSLKEKFAVMQCRTLSLQFCSDRVNATAVDALHKVLRSSRTSASLRAAAVHAAVTARSAGLVNRLDLDINENSDDLLHMWLHPLTEKYRALTLMHFFPKAVATTASMASAAAAATSAKGQGVTTDPASRPLNPSCRSGTECPLTALPSSTEISVRIHSMAKIFARFEYASSVAKSKSGSQTSYFGDSGGRGSFSSFSSPASMPGSSSFGRRGSWHGKRGSGYRRRRSSGSTSDVGSSSTIDEMQYVHGDQTQLLGNWLSLEVDAPSKRFVRSHEANIFVYSPARFFPSGGAADTAYRPKQPDSPTDSKADNADAKNANYEQQTSGHGSPNSETKDRRTIPTIDVVLPRSRLILSNMPLSKTLELSSLRLCLETRGGGGTSASESTDEAEVITQQHLDFHVTSTHLRLLGTHFNWLMSAVENWGELLEDHRLRNVFNFERTIWTVNGHFDTATVQVNAGVMASILPFDPSYGSQLELVIPSFDFKSVIPMLSFKANRPDLDVSFHVPGAIHVLYCPHLSHPFRRQTGAKRISLMKMAGFLFNIKRSARAVVADFDAATLGENDSHERQNVYKSSDVELQHLTQHLAVNVSVESVTLDFYAEIVQAGLVFFQQYVAGVGVNPERVGVAESSNARPDLPNKSHRPDLPSRSTPVPTAVAERGGKDFDSSAAMGVEEGEQDDLISVILRIVATVSVKHVVIVLPTRPLAASCMSCAPACVQEDDAAASPRISLSSLQIAIVHGDGEFLDVQTTFNSVIMYQLDSCAQRERQEGSPESARSTPSDHGAHAYPGSPEHRHRAETRSVALQPRSYIKAEASKFSFHRAVSSDILPAPPTIEKSFSAAVYRAAATVSVTNAARYRAVIAAVARATGATVFSADQTAFIRRVAMPIAHVGEANSADVAIDRASAVVHVGGIVGNVDIGFLRALSSAIDTMAFSSRALARSSTSAGFWASVGPRYTLRLRLGQMVGLSEAYIRNFRICAMIHYAGQVNWIGTYELMSHAQTRIKLDPEDSLTDVSFTCHSPLDPLRITFFSTLGWKKSMHGGSSSLFRGVQPFGEIFIPNAGRLAKQPLVRTTVSAGRGGRLPRSPSVWRRGIELVIKASRSWRQEDSAVETATNASSTDGDAELRPVERDVEDGTGRRAPMRSPAKRNSVSSNRSRDNAADFSGWREWDPQWWQRYVTSEDGVRMQSDQHKDNLTSPRDSAHDHSVDSSASHGTGSAPHDWTSDVDGLRIQIAVELTELDSPQPASTPPKAAPLTTENVLDDTIDMLLRKQNVTDPRACQIERINEAVRGSEVSTSFVRNPLNPMFGTDTGTQSENAAALSEINTGAVNEQGIEMVSLDGSSAFNRPSQSSPRESQGGSNDTAKRAALSGDGAVLLSQSVLSVDVKVPSIELSLRWRFFQERARSDRAAGKYKLPAVAAAPDDPASLTAVTTFRTCGPTTLLYAQVHKRHCAQIHVAPARLVHANSTFNTPAVNPAGNRTNIEAHSPHTVNHQSHFLSSDLPGAEASMRGAGIAEAPTVIAKSSQFAQCLVAEAVGETCINFCFVDQTRLPSPAHIDAADTEVYTDDMARYFWQHSDFEFDRYRQFAVKMINLERTNQDQESDYESIDSMASTSSDSKHSGLSSSASGGVTSGSASTQDAARHSSTHASSVPKAAFSSAETQSSRTNASDNGSDGAPMAPQSLLRGCQLLVDRKFLYHADVLPSSWSEFGGTEREATLKLFSIKTLHFATNVQDEDSASDGNFRSGRTSQHPDFSAAQPSVSEGQQNDKYTLFNKFVATSLRNSTGFNLALGLSCAALNMTISDQCVDNLCDLEIFFQEEMSTNESFSQLLMWYMPIFERELGDVSVENNASQKKLVPALKVNIFFPSMEVLYFANRSAKAFIRARLEQLRLTTKRNDTVQSQSPFFFSDSRFVVGEATLDVYGFTVPGVPPMLHDGQDPAISKRVVQCQIVNFRAKQFIGANRSNSTTGAADSSNRGNLEYGSDSEKPLIRTRLCGRVDEIHLNAGDFQIGSDSNGEVPHGNGADSNESESCSTVPSAEAAARSNPRKSFPAVDTDAYNDRDVSAVLILHRFVKHVSHVRTTVSLLNQSRRFVRISVPSFDRTRVPGSSRSSLYSSRKTVTVLPRTEIVTLFVQTLLEYEQSLRSSNIVGEIPLHQLIVQEQLTFNHRQSWVSSSQNASYFDYRRSKDHDFANEARQNAEFVTHGAVEHLDDSSYRRSRASSQSPQEKHPPIFQQSLFKGVAQSSGMENSLGVSGSAGDTERHRGTQRLSASRTRSVASARSKNSVLDDGSTRVLPVPTQVDDGDGEDDDDGDDDDVSTAAAVAIDFKCKLHNGDGDDAFGLEDDSSDTVLSGWPLMVHLGRLLLLARLRDTGMLEQQWARALQQSKLKIACDTNLVQGGCKLESQAPATLAERLRCGSHSIHRGVAQWVVAFDHLFHVMRLDDGGGGGSSGTGSTGFADGYLSASKNPDLFSFTLRHLSGKYWVQHELQKIFLCEAYHIRFGSGQYAHAAYGNQTGPSAATQVPQQRFYPRGRGQVIDSRFLNASVSSFMCTMVPTALTRIEKVKATYARQTSIASTRSEAGASATSGASSTSNPSPYATPFRNRKGSFGSRTSSGRSDQYAAVKGAVDTFTTTVQRLIDTIQNLVPGRVSSQGHFQGQINPTVLVAFESLRLYLEAGGFIGWSPSSEDEQPISSRQSVNGARQRRKPTSVLRKEVCAVVEVDRVNLSFNTFPRVHLHDRSFCRPSNCVVTHVASVNLHFNGFRKPTDEPYSQVSSAGVHVAGGSRDNDLGYQRCNSRLHGKSSSGVKGDLSGAFREGSYDISLRLLLHDLKIHATNASNAFEALPSQTGQNTGTYRYGASEKSVPHVPGSRFRGVARSSMEAKHAGAASSEDLKPARRDRISFGVAVGKSSFDVATHLLDFTRVQTFAFAWVHVLRLRGVAEKSRRQAYNGSIGTADAGARRYFRSDVQPRLSPSTQFAPSGASPSSGPVESKAQPVLDIQTLLFLDIRNWNADVSLSPQLRVSYHLSSLFTSITRHQVQRNFGFKLRVGSHHICFGHNQRRQNSKDEDTVGAPLKQEPSPAKHLSQRSNLQNLAQVWIQVKEQNLKSSLENGDALPSREHGSTSVSPRESAHRRIIGGTEDVSGRAASVEWIVLVGRMKNRFHFKHLHQMLVLSETLNNEFLIGLVKNPALFAKDSSFTGPAAPSSMSTRKPPISSQVQHSDGDNDSRDPRLLLRRKRKRFQRHSLSLCMQNMQVALVASWKGGLEETAVVVEIKTLRCNIQRVRDIAWGQRGHNRFERLSRQDGGDSSSWMQRPLNSLPDVPPRPSWAAAAAAARLGQPQTSKFSWTGQLDVSNASVRFVLPRLRSRELPLSFDEANSARRRLPSKYMRKSAAGTECPHDEGDGIASPGGSQSTPPPLGVDASSVAPFYSANRHIASTHLEVVTVQLSRNRRVSVQIHGLAAFLHPLCSPATLQLLDSIQFQKQVYKQMLRRMFDAPVNEVSRGIHKMWANIVKKTDAQLSGLRRYFRGSNQASVLHLQVSQVQVAVPWHTMVAPATPLETILSAAQNEQHLHAWSTKPAPSGLATDVKLPRTSPAGSPSTPQVTDGHSGKGQWLNSELDAQSLDALLQSQIEVLVLSSQQLKALITIRKTEDEKCGTTAEEPPPVGSAMRDPDRPFHGNEGAAISKHTFFLQARVSTAGCQAQTVRSPGYTLERFAQVDMLAKLCASISAACFEEVLGPVEEYVATQLQSASSTTSAASGGGHSQHPGDGHAGSSSSSSDKKNPTRPALACSGIVYFDDLRGSLQAYLGRAARTTALKKRNDVNVKSGSTSQPFRRNAPGPPKTTTIIRLSCKGSTVVISPSIARVVAACVATTTAMKNLESQARLVQQSTLTTNGRVAGNRNSSSPAHSSNTAAAPFSTDWNVGVQFANNFAILSLPDNLLDLCKKEHTKDDIAPEDGSGNPGLGARSTDFARGRLASLRPRPSLIRSFESTPKKALVGRVPGFHRGHLVYQLPTVSSKVLSKHVTPKDMLEGDAPSNYRPCFFTAVTVNIHPIQSSPGLVNTERGSSASGFKGGTTSTHRTRHLPVWRVQSRDLVISRLLLANILDRWRVAKRASQTNQYAQPNLLDDSSTESFSSPFLLSRTTILGRVDPFCVSFSPGFTETALKMPSLPFSGNADFHLNIECNQPIDISVSFDQEQIEGNASEGQSIGTGPFDFCTVLLSTPSLRLAAEQRPVQFSLDTHGLYHSSRSEQKDIRHQHRKTALSKSPLLDLQFKGTRAELHTGQFRDSPAADATRARWLRRRHSSVNVDMDALTCSVDMQRYEEAVQFIDDWSASLGAVFKILQKARLALPVALRTAHPESTVFLSAAPSTTKSAQRQRCTNFRFSVPTVELEVDIMQWIDSRAVLRMDMVELFSQRQLKPAATAQGPYVDVNHVLLQTTDGQAVCPSGSTWNRTAHGLQISALELLLEGRLQGHVSVPGGLAGVRLCNVLATLLRPPRTALGSGDGFEATQSTSQSAAQHNLEPLLAEVPVSYLFVTVTPFSVSLNHCLRPPRVMRSTTRISTSSRMDGGDRNAAGTPERHGSQNETLEILQGEAGCIFIKCRDVPARLLSKKNRSLRAFLRSLQKACLKYPPQAAGWPEHAESDDPSFLLDEGSWDRTAPSDGRMHSADTVHERQGRDGSQHAPSFRLENVEWNTEMVLHFDSILCSGAAQTYSGFRSTLARMMHSHGESFTGNSPGSLVDRLRRILQLHGSAHRYAHLTAVDIADSNFDLGYASPAATADRGMRLRKAIRKTPTGSVGFAGEVRMVVVRSQCEFVDRDPNQGVIFSLGNIATRLLVSQTTRNAKKAGNPSDAGSAPRTPVHEPGHQNGTLEEKLKLSPTGTSRPAIKHRDGAGFMRTVPAVSAADTFALRKLEVVLLTAVLRFRIGSGADSMLRDVITLPNSKLRMLTQELTLRQGRGAGAGAGASIDEGMNDRNAGTATGAGGARVVDIIEYVTEWDNRIKLSTDIRLYERLKVAFSHLSADLRSHSTRSDYGIRDMPSDRHRHAVPGGPRGNSGSDHSGDTPSASRLSKKVIYGFDNCVIQLNPQVDVLKGLTPSFGQVLVQLGSSTRKFVSGTDSVVRYYTEKVAEVVCRVSNAVDGPVNNGAMETDIDVASSARSRRAK